jgi:hypothetical protein
MGVRYGYKIYYYGGYFFILANVHPLFGEEILDLPAIEGSHSVGNDQNKLGINAYKKKKSIKP